MHRQVVGLGGGVDAGIGQRRNRLLVEPADRLDAGGVEFRDDCLEPARIAADQQIAHRVDEVGQSGIAGALVILGPADDAGIGLEFQERQCAPPEIGVQRLDTGDLHVRPPSRTCLG
jgi:hypothetical protein